MTLSTQTVEPVMTASNRPDRHRLVVVTGASTGMGAATARELAGRGYHVLAGVRRDVDADALRADGMNPMWPPSPGASPMTR
jgi:NADP-dependent 3-hydroxy acid dehydrogenase YdfG